MSALQAGSQAPDFSLSDRNGKVRSLYEALEGELVLLTFFKITCPIGHMGESKQNVFSK